MKNERQIETDFIEKLRELNYVYRDDIKDKDSLEENFRAHFQKLNRVNLSDSEFARFRESIITPDVFASAKQLRETNTFKRDDDTPLQYTLVNTTDWCKNEYEVVNQLRINTENSYHRYDVMILINGIPVVQVELKSLQVTPKRAMEQIVAYKNDPGNSYTNSLLCFVQLFIVSNESNTYYFANNNREHFSFDADERFLPVYRLVISSHHTLFYNVLCNETKKPEQLFLQRAGKDETYILKDTGETPYFYHVALLKELKKAADAGELYTYHFNILRGILEKTASFHGYRNFSACLRKENDENSPVYARIVNLLSHGDYSIFEPREMVEENKEYFRTILNNFIEDYRFNPDLFQPEQTQEEHG